MFIINQTKITMETSTRCISNPLQRTLIKIVFAINTKKNNFISKLLKACFQAENYYTVHSDIESFLTKLNEKTNTNLVFHIMENLIEEN